MPQHDYLKKQIDQLGKVLKAALEMLTGGESDSAIRLNHAYEMICNALGIKEAELKRMTAKELIELFSKEQLDSYTQILVVKVKSITSQTEKRKNIELLLTLLNHLSETDQNYSFQRHQQISSLQLQLKELDINEE